MDCFGARRSSGLEQSTVCVNQEVLYTDFRDQGRSFRRVAFGHYPESQERGGFYQKPILGWNNVDDFFSQEWSLSTRGNIAGVLFYTVNTMRGIVRLFFRMRADGVGAEETRRYGGQRPPRDNMLRCGKPMSWLLPQLPENGAVLLFSGVCH